MDAINSVESRKLTSIQSMQILEKAVLYFTHSPHPLYRLADQRSRIRRDISFRSSWMLALLVTVPGSLYMLYVTKSNF